jgi:hypothetical protein
MASYGEISMAAVSIVGDWVKGVTHTVWADVEDEVGRSV